MSIDKETVKYITYIQTEIQSAVKKYVLTG